MGNNTSSSSYEIEEIKTDVKYEPRIAQPYVGWAGIVMYIWELIVMLWVFCMFVDVYNNQPFTFMGLIITTCVVAAILWLVNCLRCAPYYQTMPTTVYEKGDRSEILVMKKAPNYAIKLQRDLQFHHDQTHFQSTLFSLSMVILFLGVFLGLNGLHSFQPIPSSFTNLDTMNYVKVKGFHLIVIGCLAWSFAHLMESKSDLIFRHFTAMNKEHREENGGKDYPLGNKLNSKRKDVNSQNAFDALM
jgi:hypothetical protein